MPSYTPTQFGYFLTYNFWQDAIKLLDYQLERKNHPKIPNRHFSTFSMFYYEKLNSEFERVRKEKYFKNRVANNFFYVLANEFAIYSYVQPKSGLGLRSYIFMTYSMRVLYYAVCLYLIRLCEDYMKYVLKTPQINSFYGGKLEYGGKETIPLSPRKVYYKHHYNKFRQAVMQESEQTQGQVVCLRLDIEKYFDSIRLEILLNEIVKRVKETDQNKYKFDAETIEQLRTFFQFLNTGIGIPQMDNGITSDYIGFLYFLIGDVYIYELLQEHIGSNLIVEFKMFRYVDDTYFFITFPDSISDSDKDSLTRKIGSQIADLLYSKLALRCSTSKTGYFRLSRENELQELHESLKKVSPDEAIPDEDDSTPPQERVDAIFSELKILKQAELNTRFDYATKMPEKERLVAGEVMKNVFAPDVDKILNRQENIDALSQILDEFNFDFFQVSPATMLTILCRPKLAKKREEFRRYLIEMPILTNKEIDLTLRFLAYDNFKDNELIQSLKQEPHMATIIEVFEQSKIIPRNTGYFAITSGLILKLKNFQTVIHQIRLRREAESNLAYSDALNHLLNEIHSICYESHRVQDKSMTKSIHNYKADNVNKFLVSKNVPFGIRTQIRNLFDRRNMNTKSHAGSNEHPAKDVKVDDYNHYRDFVGECLKYILK